MESVYSPYFDPEFESLIERINPPRVCIDNNTYENCTLVKVDSANKHGILLEMVQVLTDLDLVISKSYICSDGGWFMDVFHVTDQLGNKLTDESLLLYIKQALCASRRGGVTKEGRAHPAGREVRPGQVSKENTAIEMTCTDRPGLLSEISAVLAEMGCQVTAAVAWTHKTRAASIIYVEDGTKGGPITDPDRLAHIEEQLENVVEAHDGLGERRSLRLTAPAAGQTHTERRLHQLMAGDRDYESCCSCDCGGSGGGGEVKDGSGWRYSSSRHRKDCCETYVSIESLKEKGYSVVNMRSRDRPKLLFDTVCALTDMQYVVFHAAVSSKGSIAVQEYFIRQRNGGTLDSETERHRVSQCLVAAVERRASHGLRLDVCTQNRGGLLSDITRVFRENGLSISRAEIGTRGERAIGSFYVTEASGHDMNPNTLDLVRNEIGGTVLVVNKSTGWPSSAASLSSNTNRSTGGGSEEKPKFSLGSLLWSHLERLSSSFRPIRS